MERRRKNNILIGVLCCALVFMGIGYAVLNATLSIGATANITGNFDIHFSSIQRSSTNIVDSTILSTMASGTGVTNSPANTEGEFTAVLQKPGDYVIYDVVVVNTGSIDGYLTFTFGDENNNFDYYSEFYKVEFIRDNTDPTPDIIADIVQNQTFTDNEVLVKTNGTRTYQIKVTYKSTADSFPDATTYDDFECGLSLTYSQSAPASNNSGNSQQEVLTYYTDNPSSPTTIASIDSNKVLKTFTVDAIDQLRDDNEEVVVPLIPYTSSVTFNDNRVGITLQEGDYIFIDSLEHNVCVLLRGTSLYIYLESLYTLTEDSNYDPTPVITWYSDNSLAPTMAVAVNQYHQLVEIFRYNSESGKVFETLIPYSSNPTIETNNLTVSPQSGDYLLVDGTELFGILRGNTFYWYDDYRNANYILTLDNNYPPAEVETWYYGEAGGMTAAISINQYMQAKHLIVNGTDMIAQKPFTLTSYVPGTHISENLIEVEPQEGDYVLIDVSALMILLRGTTMVGRLNEQAPIVTLQLVQNATLSDFTS